MGRGPAAVVLTPYALDPIVGRGGAQRVAAELCDRLRELGWTVAVIESAAWRRTIVSPEPFETLMADHPATIRCWPDDPPAAIAPDQAADAVAEARLVLVLDRALGRLNTAAHRVLLLSNLAYSNERQSVHGDFDAVWVPSEYLGQALAGVGPIAPADIYVVPPALDGARCDPAAHEPLRALDERLSAECVPLERRLLFPHRSDHGKGLPSAYAALRELLKQDRWALIAIQPRGDEPDEVAATFDEAQRDGVAAGIADHVHWTPWLPRPEMPCLYGLGGVTLMPTTLEEGFGLVAVESVVAGVPAVVRPVGNLDLLARRFPDVHPAREVSEMTHIAAAVSGRPVPGTRRQAVSEAFSASAQRAAVTAALTAGVAVSCLLLSPQPCRARSVGNDAPKPLRRPVSPTGSRSQLWARHGITSAVRCDRGQPPSMW